MASPRIKILVAGCSYGGITTVVNLLDWCTGKVARNFMLDKAVPHLKSPQRVAAEIHVVDPRDGYLHLIGSPLAFSSIPAAEKMWVKFSDIPALQHESVHVLQGTVAKVNPEQRTAQIKLRNGEQRVQTYDYFVAATGLKRRYPVVPQSFTREDYLVETAEHVRSVRAAQGGVVVIGGGAVGVEMAAELKHLQPDLKVTLVHSRDKLMSAEPLPDEFRDVVLKTVREGGVEVILGRGRVVERKEDQSSKGGSTTRLTFEDGSHIFASRVIDAVSNQIPCTDFLPPAVLNSEGLVKINNLLRFLDNGSDTRHYAIGDIAAWSGIKRCGAAMFHGHLVADTIYQDILCKQKIIEQPHFSPIQEVPPMIALAMGSKAAVYTPSSGVECDEMQMKIFFGDDLGFTGCWNHAQLSEKPEMGNSNGCTELPQTAPYRQIAEESRTVVV